MVSLAPHGDQRLNRHRLAGGNIGRAEISVVGKQCFGLAQRILQSNDLVQHRFELLLIVGGLHHIRRHHQQAALGHHRLGVVALLEPATCYRHNAGFFVDQIDLVGWQRTFHRRLRRLTTGFFAGGCDLRFPRRDLCLMRGLLPVEPLLRPCLDRRAGRCKLLHPYFAPLQFLRYRQAVGDIRLIRRLGLGQKLGHFRC